MEIRFDYVKKLSTSRVDIAYKTQIWWAVPTEHLFSPNQILAL
jgi:hypothetical protein